MKRMIRELKTSGHVFIDEQQVEAVIKSLPKSCEHMVVNITHDKKCQDIWWYGLPSWIGSQANYGC